VLNSKRLFRGVAYACAVLELNDVEDEIASWKVEAKILASKNAISKNGELYEKAVEDNRDQYLPEAEGSLFSWGLFISLRALYITRG